MEKMTTALIIVDVQNDFVEGGALAVAGGKAIVHRIDGLSRWLGKSILTVFSQDWHPLETAHFDKWPVHCIAGSKGSELVNGLPRNEKDIIIHKGMSDKDDGYSAFDGTDLNSILSSRGIKSLYVCGIATDYCVRETVMDALAGGYHVVVVLDCCVATTYETGNKAIEEMIAAGASIMERTVHT